MHLALRLRMLLLAGLLGACSASPGGTPVSPETPGAATAMSTVAPPSANASVTPSPTAHAVPAMTAIQPVAIEVPESTGFISVTTDGTTVWASANGAIFTIDAATGSATSLPAPSQSDDTTLEIADDGLWMTRWGGGHVYRLDPDTGKVQLSVELAAAVRLAFVGGDLWVGRESSSEMLLIDRKSGAIGRSVHLSAYGVAGLEDLWFTIGGSVKRIDPASGGVKASIAVQNEGNCSVSGAFPANAWVTCFGRDVVARTAVRLDPEANVAATVATLPPCHGGSVSIIDGQAWFVGTFEEAPGKPFGALLRLNRDTGAIERFLSIGPADPDPAVVAGGALWIPDEVGHRILRVDLDDLAA